MGRGPAGGEPTEAGPSKAGGTRLLEREQELAAVESLLESAAAGRGGLVAIDGDPGLGKSTLIEMGAGEAEERGIYPLVARGHALEQEFGFGIARQLLEPAVVAASETDGGGLFEGAARLAAPLFLGDVSAQQQLDPQSINHGLQWLATNLAAESALLLAVDDAQWADTPSVRFLVYLAERLAELPIALLVAERPGDPTVAAELRYLRQRAGANLATLAPLSPAAVEVAIRELAGWDADPVFCDACADVTGGNPFLLDQMLQELSARGIEPVRESVGRVRDLVPAEVVRSTLIRIAELSEDAVAVARAVAVLEAEATPARAARLAGIGLDAASEAIEALRGTAILGAGREPHMAHPLIRSAIEEDMSPERRSHLHHEAARLLEAEGAPIEIVAEHLLAVTAMGDPWIVATLRAAAREALAKGAPDAAAAFLRRAHEAPPAREERGTVLRELGEAEVAARIEGGADHLRQAVTHLEAPGERAAALLTLGRAVYAQGDLTGAVEAFDGAIAELGGNDPELRMSLEAERYQAASLVPDLAASALERVAPLLSGEVDAAAESGRAILATAAVQAAFMGEPAEAVLGLARRALAGSGLVREGLHGNALYTATMALMAVGEYRWDAEVLTEAIDLARDRGSEMAFATASFCRCGPRLELGELSGAAADGEQALAARRDGWAQFVPGAIGLTAVAHIFRGDLDAARGLLAEPVSWEEDLLAAFVLRARGHLKLLEGDANGALRDFRAWGDAFPFRNPATHGRWRSHAAEALARLGEYDEARALASEELELTRPVAAPAIIGASQAALGRVLRGKEAVETLTMAVQTLDGTDAALARCRASIDLGAALRRAGNPARARDQLANGLEVARSLGAGLLVAQAQEELRAAGARPRRTALRGVEALTPGELRVVELAAAGHTNREIAEALFVTVKAVEWHLRNAYPKLGISSRKKLRGIAGLGSAAGAEPS